MIRAVFLTLALGASALACSSEAETDATASDDEALRSSFENPLLSDGQGGYENCGAPSVRRHGDTYVLVCAAAHIGHSPEAYPVRVSKDLVHWGPPHPVFTDAHHPAWARAPGPGGYWCPEIYRLDGKWLLLFAATTRHGAQAIGSATADSPEGPWTASEEPLVAPGDGLLRQQNDAGSGRIDPTLLVDDAGELVRDGAGNLQLYFVYQPRWVHTVRLHSDGRGHLATVAGTEHELSLLDGRPFAPTFAWEKTVIEGVEAQRHGGEVFLLYSGASAWDESYALGVARAPGPDGPFEKRDEPILSTAPSASLVGPGHSAQWVTGPDGKLWLAYRVQRRGHTGHGGTQLLALDEVTFGPEGWPRVGDGHPNEHPHRLP